MARRGATASERLAIAETLFVRKRESAPYRTIFIDGFDYAVRSTDGSRKKISLRYRDFADKSGFPTYLGDDSEASDIRTALTLHCLNIMSIAAIRFMGSWLDAYDNDESPPDLGIDVDEMRVMYERLRHNYTVDDVYEAIAEEPDDTSYVINNGEEVHLCVRCGQRPDSKIVLIAVLAHELAHVASSTPDHDDEFWTHHGIMQKVIARLGIIDEPPVAGATHCGLVFIDQTELGALYDPVAHLARDDEPAGEDPVDEEPSDDVAYYDGPIEGYPVEETHAVDEELVAPPLPGISAPGFVARRSDYTAMSDPTMVSFPEFTDRMYDAMRVGDREVPLGTVLRAAERPNPKFLTYRRRTAHDLTSRGILHESIIE